MATAASLPAPTFDLESWAANYSGPLLPLRLAHIAAHCPPLSRRALELGIDSAKRGKDTHVYRRLVDIAATLGQAVEEDAEWVARQDDTNKRELARLEGELRGYKNNLIRESIRMGQEDLATHLLLTGGPPPPETSSQHQQYGLAVAYAAFGKMRDFCTTPTHIAGMTLRLLFTSLVQAMWAMQTGGSPTGHLAAVGAHASRLRSVGVKDEEQVLLNPLSAASAGIAHLAQAQYRDAALFFLAVPFELTSHGPVLGFDFCRSAAAANDIAVYGGLTALATLSREDLNAKVLGGPFRAFLELEPHVRKAITLFTTGKYRACLDTLQRYRPDWCLDLQLGAGLGSPRGSHVDRLFARVRERSITAYFSSFSQVSLSSLASTFPPSPSSTDAGVSPDAAIEAEIVSLIQSGALDGRLDVVNRLLIAPSVELRSATHRQAMDTAEEVERTLLQRLHKVNVSLAHLEISRPKGQGSGQGWSDGVRS